MELKENNYPCHSFSRMKFLVVPSRVQGSLPHAQIWQSIINNVFEQGKFTFHLIWGAVESVIIHMVRSCYQHVLKTRENRSGQLTAHRCACQS